MKPSARIQAVIEIFGIAEKSNVPLSKICGDYFRTRRYIGSKDRSSIAERAYRIARCHARFEWWFVRSGVQATPRAHAIADLALNDNAAPVEIQNLFAGVQYAPDQLIEVEQDFVNLLQGQSLDDPNMSDAVRVECPPEYEDALRERFGEDFVTEMQAMMMPAPLDLRVNTVLINREDAIKSLAGQDVHVTETPYAPHGLRADDKPFLSNTKAFTKGLVDIQDEGSQLVAVLCNAKPGMQVMDYCAGGGGKTLALAAQMENKGRIVAMDIDAKRLTRSRDRLKRAKIHNYELRPLDEKHRKWVRRQKGKFDIVLVDAPCSGTGTWRRNPDMRWRHIGPDLDSLLTTQREILGHAAKLVKPGGRFVYATCSLLKAENDDQMAWFEGEHPEFEVLPMDQAWSCETRQPCDGAYMKLSPAQHNTDGFFAATYIKKAD